ncbi:carboxypeptidase regulatory-like domain-containing protein [Patescibacteria group bacterium]|nr:carboxypeptidase regulatory-like domain-containing protein [Patescibacteria group bacterium]
MFSWIYKSALGIGLFVFVVSSLAILSAQAIGFRIDKNFSLVRTGIISVINLDSEVKVFLDNRRTGTFSEAAGGSIVIKNVLPGTHSLLVSKEGYWPWIKEVKVQKKETSTAYPFFILKNTNGIVILKEDEEYTSIKESIESEVLPEKGNKLISASGTHVIWVEENTIMAEWLGEEDALPFYFCSYTECTRTVEVLASLTAIRNLTFYKEREDVLIFSSQNGLFAIEIDAQGIQNFQHIYKGAASPDFSIYDDQTLSVYDAGSLFLLLL